MMYVAGLVTDWDGMERIWNHTFYDQRMYRLEVTLLRSPQASRLVALVTLKRQRHLIVDTIRQRHLEP